MWETILEPLRRLAEVMNENWTNILATLLLLFGGWMLARGIRLLLVRGLRIARLDLVAEKAGIEEFLRKGGIKQDAVELLGALIYWIAVIIIVLTVMRVWNVEIGLSDTLVPFLPKVLVSLVILILGLYIASFVGDMVRTAAANAEVAYARLLGQVVRYVLVILVVLTSLQQLGIQTELISTGFLLILGSICLGMGLAIGLGARDVVARKLEEWVARVEEESKRES
jgi:hypothetical protein